MFRDKHFTIRIMLRAGIIALFFSVILSVFLLFFNQNPIPYALGLLVGSGINILLFRLHYLNLSTLLDRNAGAAKKGASFNYSIRYFITFAVLAISYLSKSLNFVTCALGFLMIRISIYIEVFYQKKNPSNSKKDKKVLK